MDFSSTSALDFGTSLTGDHFAQLRSGRARPPHKYGLARLVASPALRYRPSRLATLCHFFSSQPRCPSCRLRTLRPGPEVDVARFGWPSPMQRCTVDRSCRPSAPYRTLISYFYYTRSEEVPRYCMNVLKFPIDQRFAAPRAPGAVGCCTLFARPVAPKPRPTSSSH